MAGRLISNAADLQPLEAGWNGLCLAQPRPNPMLSWDWAATWWKVYGTMPGLSLAVWVEESGGRIESILPLYRSPEGKGATFRYLGTGEDEADAVCGDYLGPLAYPEGREMPLPARSESLLLSDMTSGDPGCERLIRTYGERGFLVRRAPGPVCPFVPLPSNEEALFSTFSANFRSQIRQSEKAWKTQGDPRIRWVETPADLGPFWSDLTRLHQERWRSLGRPGVFASAKFAAFHREIAERFFRRGWLEGGVLEAGGKAMAAVYAFRLGGTVFFYQSGTGVDAPAKLRPGLLLHVEAMRRAIARKDREYDLLRGDDPYKRRFTSHTRQLFHAEIGRPTFRRRLRFCSLAVKDRLRRLRQTDPLPVS